MPRPLHTVSRRILKSFDEKVGQDLLFRRLGISADSLVNAISTDKVTSGRDVQMNLLGDYDSDRFKAMEDMNRISAELERENNIQQAMLDVRKKYGTNSIVKGFNMLEGATAMERNVLIGGHKA